MKIKQQKEKMITYFKRRHEGDPGVYHFPVHYMRWIAGHARENEI